MSPTKTTTKVKLPPNPFIHEILELASKQRSKAKKIEILKEYKTPALTKVLLCNFSKSISFVFPSGETPYRPLDRPKGIEHQMLITEHRMLEKFIKKTINGVTWYGCSNRTAPSIQQLKKENLWIQVLEGLHPDESAVLDLIKDKKLNERYKITKQNVIDAFPELNLDKD